MFMTAAFLIVLATYLAVVSAGDALTGECIKDKFEEWKKCHKGFKGVLMDDMKAAIETCKGKQIKEKMCFKVCFIEEMKMCKDGKLDEAKLKSHLDNMFDQTVAEGVATEAKWIEDTKRCIAEFQTSGKKFPKDYSGDCKEIEDLHKCIENSRKC